LERKKEVVKNILPVFGCGMTAKIQSPQPTVTGYNLQRYLLPLSLGGEQNDGRR